MPAFPFILVSPATRGLSLALTRHYLKHTNLPVYATHRSSLGDDVRSTILSSFSQQDAVDPARLNLLHLDLTSEASIQSAADALSDSLPHDKQSFIHTAFFTGGILHPEKNPSDLDFDRIQETFQLNVISHLLLIKHFSRFLPSAALAKTISDDKSSASDQCKVLSKWVHVSARVGSISDNRLGGWFSYRASKSALNQVVRTFDLHLQSKRVPAICVGVHPGTVKTDLSKPFWGGVEKEGKLFPPEFAAEKLAGVVDRLGYDGRGKVWDWAGKEVKP
ncbi:hypothetical protein EUX98_g7571 [Antrodiella citrinella]|uniref:NAD(P)-binding protein n=1 Tax=Antrodiella citrinella TaxID=2447956 RepID=A0A4S4ML69_9APHY|nr:hypothetical protein EUX98_g7571 [Antrodiella citrinella]